MCARGDAPAKGLIENRQRFARSNFEPGRRFASPLDYQDQLDRWCERVNARSHRTLRCRPLDRLREELEAMAQLPERPPDLDRRFVVRVPQDPHVRFDTNDYSLEPRLVGRRVEVRVSQREVVAVALGSGELCARHARSFARHRTITALEHRLLLRELRDARREPQVERRPLSRYDRLIPA